VSLSPLAASAYIQVYTAVAFPFRIYSYSRSCFDAFSHLLTDEAARKEVIFGYYRNKRASVTQKKTIRMKINVKQLTIGTNEKLKK
jgi:hypothetical protein